MKHIEKHKHTIGACILLGVVGYLVGGLDIAVVAMGALIGVTLVVDE